jgi:hypothetical protein
MQETLKQKESSIEAYKAMNYAEGLRQFEAQKELSEKNLEEMGGKIETLGSRVDTVVALFTEFRTGARPPHRLAAARREREA